ncbi:endonuclease III domain-containing protein [Buchananella felis]|uniref:endonuclease III domain-containing protein n=1 Tax=Buchananella felis TaxID=3231492 RepID=UPI003527C264
MRALFELLSAQVPSGHWWPGRTRFEIAAGAVLTQNTNWANASAAIANLDAAGLLTPQRLLLADDAHLAALIRPAGFWKAKTGYLKALACWFQERDPEAQRLEAGLLRRELLAVRGIGEETADDLLVYVYDRPVFIYDLYARRLLAAAGFGHYPSYGAAKRALDPLVAEAGFTAAELARFHGLIVDGGKLARVLGGWEVAYPLLAAGSLTTAVAGAAARDGAQAARAETCQ